MLLLEPKMARHNKNARQIHYSTLSFRQLCKKVGITPYQRIMILRFKEREINKTKDNK